MRGLFAIAIALLSGCEYREPGMTSAQIQQIAAEQPGMTQACLDELRWGGVNAWRPDDPDCYQMMPAQRWSGLWDHGWEWSNFCPSPTRQQCHWDESSLEEAPRGTWLTFAKSAHLLHQLPDGIPRIEFIGRRTELPGYFGNLGDYEHLMFVDRVISIRTIPGEKYTKRL